MSKIQDKLGKVGKHGKVSDRTHQGKTGTDVVECRSNCRKVGDKIEVIQRDQQHGKGKNKNVDAHVNICGADNLVLDRLAVNLDAAYTPGIRHWISSFYRFQQDQDAGNLNAAAGTSGTGTDKHQQDEDGAENSGHRSKFVVA